MPDSDLNLRSGTLVPLFYRYGHFAGVWDWERKRHGMWDWRSKASEKALLENMTRQPVREKENIQRKMTVKKKTSCERYAVLEETMKQKEKRGKRGWCTCKHTHIHTNTMMTAVPILNITSKHTLISPSAKSPYPRVRLVSEHPPHTLHPTCGEARWHTWLWDFVVLYLMMNYASAAVTLKNAITSVIRQMGLFCLAYAVHLLRV